MVRRLCRILGSTSYEDSTIYSLNAAKADWNIKILKQLLPTSPIVVNIIVSDNLLIELEEMNFVDKIGLILVCGASHFRAINIS